MTHNSPAVPAALKLALGITSNHVNTFDAKAELIALENESYALFREAVESIKLIKQQFLCVNAVSFGKDSLVVLLASLSAHVELLQENKIAKDTPFIVTNINTLVENHAIQMLVQDEIQHLTQYANSKGIKLEINIGVPRLDKQWGSLYLSGLKLPSVSRANNDCSVILKVDTASEIERKIVNKYGQETVTLIGSRAFESQARAQSLRTKDQYGISGQVFLDGVAAGAREMVFAPISTMTDDHVWMIIKRAGEFSPATFNNGQKIESYRPNHRLIHLIYGDAKDGACPTTSKPVPGQSPGGCGGSARTGCFTCLKSKRSKSDQAFSNSLRHSVISGNMLKVRNYLMYISQNIEYRTWHTKAIDQTTGAIAAQPNVLSSEKLDELIKLMCQVTADEIIRAKSFSQKLSTGDELLDAGYADIFNDSSIELEDKLEFAQLYRTYAKEPLVEPITEDMAYFLSAIHARDGVKLPPARAIWLYQKLVKEFISEVMANRSNKHGILIRSIEESHKYTVEQWEKSGVRIPYPEVDLDAAVISDIPDAVMIEPIWSLAEHSYTPSISHFDTDTADGCLIESGIHTEKFSSKTISCLLGAQLDGKTTSIRGFTQNGSLFDCVRTKPIKSKLNKAASFRPVKKTTTKNGFKVVGRGRTSLDKSSFGLRTATPALAVSLLKSTPYLVPCFDRTYSPIVDEQTLADGRYLISKFHIEEFSYYSELSRLLDKHDQFVERANKRSDSIYRYSGPAVFETLLNFGILQLNETALSNSLFMLKRTDYFNQIGLFSLSDSEFLKLCQSEDVNLDVSLGDFRTDLTKGYGLYIRSILPMPEYRLKKAQLMLQLRRDRNTQRKAVKLSVAQYHEDKARWLIDMTTIEFQKVFADLEVQVKELARLYDLKAQNCLFITENGEFKIEVIETWLQYVFSFTSAEVFLELLTPDFKKHVKANIQIKAELNEVLIKLNRDMILILDGYRCFSSLTERLATTNQVSYSLSDSPVQVATQIEW